METTNLIPLDLTVQRAADGSWSNPHIPDFDEDMAAYRAWTAAQGIETTYVMLESEDPDLPAYISYFEDESGTFAGWQPEHPKGEGWHTFSIHDTEDGPAWVWARRVPA